MAVRLPTLLDFIYPRTCAGCTLENPEPSPHVCWDCLAEMTFIQPPFCRLCGNPVSGFIDHEYVCSLCSASRPHYERARSCGRHDGLLRNMLVDFKYNGALWLAEDLARILHACLLTHYDTGTIDAVGFVPLYGRRQRERGYNQAEVLARALARKLHKPLLSRCLVRTRPTESQTNLTAAERLTNVRDAFAVRWKRWVEGRRVLLIDDVMTTGATVSECARALKLGGAARVSVLTVARR